MIYYFCNCNWNEIPNSVYVLLTKIVIYESGDDSEIKDCTNAPVVLSMCKNNRNLC